MSHTYLPQQQQLCLTSKNGAVDNNEGVIHIVFAARIEVTAAVLHTGAARRLRATGVKSLEHHMSEHASS